MPPNYLARSFPGRSQKYIDPSSLKDRAKKMVGASRETRTRGLPPRPSVPKLKAKDR